MSIAAPHFYLDHLCSCITAVSVLSSQQLTQFLYVLSAASSHILLLILVALPTAFLHCQVGVSAYNGALQAFADPMLMSAAASIGAVEAYHAGLVRTLLYQTKDDPTGYTGVDVKKMTGLISTLRDSADKSGTVEDNNIVGATAGTPTIVSADANGLAYKRSPDGVLGIVYLTGNASKPGGFFPEGLTGGCGCYRVICAAGAGSTGCCTGIVHSCKLHHPWVHCCLVGKSSDLLPVCN